MIIIEQIEIKNFRSFGNRKGETTKLVKLNSLNILSGSNDSGKSNILRALNLFFNGHTDLNIFFDFQRDFFKKEKPDKLDIKEELVTIKIWFSNLKNKSKNQKQPEKVFLPEKFWVSKKWKKTSNYSQFDPKSNVEVSFRHEKGSVPLKSFLDESNTLKSMIKASLQKQLTEYLAQIQFHYIPAIKDKQYFSHLFGELQQTLWKAQTSKVNKKKNDFQAEIQKETLILMEEFKETLSQQNTHYEPVFQLPENLVDLFKTLQVQTGDVELSQRGDGVQAKLIPEILNYISIKERSFTSRTVRKDVQAKKHFIWGFEEPENSYEYKNAQLLADRFKNKFCQSAQIFITTHSFNFLSVNGENVEKFRVWQDDLISASRISRIEICKNGAFSADDSKLSDSYKLNEELGVFSLNMELEQLFQETERIRTLLANKISEIEQHDKCLFVEDEYCQIYQIAWLKLNNIEFSVDSVNDTFVDNADFTILGLKGAGAVAGLLRSKNPNVLKNSKIVGVFDFDKAGSENFHHLRKEKYWEDKVNGEKRTGFYRKRIDHPFWYGMLLPVPDRISILADLQHDNFASYVEIENLLPESFLKRNNFVQEKLVVGTKYLKMKDTCKSKLWTVAATLTSDSFSDFTPLFDTFDYLVNNEKQ
jgi:hypothetical protein